MNNRVLFTFVLFLIGGMSCSAQLIIAEYPYENYMYVESFCEPTHFHPTGMTLYEDGCPGYDITVCPFFTKHDEVDSSKRIYGIAIPFILDGMQSGLINPSAVHRTFTLSIFKASAGDTVLNIVKQQQFEIIEGQQPDVAVLYTEEEHNPDVKYLAMFEFYFDHPVDVTGLFFVGIDMDNNESFINNGIQHAVLNPIYMPCGFPAYYGVVERKTLGLIVYYYTNDYGDDVTIPRDYFEPIPMPIPDVEDNGLHIKWTQLFYPIIKRRNTSINDAEEESARVGPNPAHGQVNVTTETGIHSIVVTDLAARIVMRKKYDTKPTKVNLDVAELPRGVYAIKVETSSGITTQKLLLQ